MPRTRGPGSPQIVSSRPLSATLAPAGPMPQCATQNWQNVRGGYSAGRLHVLGTEHHRLQSPGLFIAGTATSSAPDAGSAGPGILVRRSGISSWTPGHRSEDGLEQLTGGDATFSGLTQPTDARLTAFSEQPPRYRQRW